MALGLLAGAAKLLGGKEKKSGAKMASAIVKREPQQDAIAKKQPQIKSKTKVVSVSSLMDTKSFESQSRKQSKKSSGVDSIDGALDSIDNTLDGLIATIKSSSQFQKDEIKRKNRSRIRRGKREREGELEGGVPKFGMRVPGPFKSAFNTIKNFFSNIIIGSLVLLVVNNIESIMNSLKKVYDTMKNVVTKVGEFLQPLWTALKWIWPGNSPSGLEMVRAILANKNTQDLMDERKINEIKEESDKVVEETKRLEGLFKNIEKDANIEPEDEMEPPTMNDVPPPPPPAADVRSAESPSIWDSVGQFFSGIGNAITGGEESVGGNGKEKGKEGKSSLSHLSPEARAWLGAINAVEAGGPDKFKRLVGTEVVPELTQMTIQEVYDMAYGREIGKGNLPARFGGREVKYGASSHATGAYQFHPDTMLLAAETGNISRDTLYTPTTQHLLALAWAKRLGIDTNKPMDPASLAIAGSEGGWEGLSVTKGKITQGEGLSLYNQMLQREKKSPGSAIPSAGILGNQSNINATLSRQIASFPSYANSGGTTIIAMDDGNNQPTVVQGGGKSNSLLLAVAPSAKEVMLNNYEFRVQSSLWKVG